MSTSFLLVFGTLFIGSIISNWKKHDEKAKKMIFFGIVSLIIALMVIYILPYQFSLYEVTNMSEIVKVIINLMKG